LQVTGKIASSADPKTIAPAGDLEETLEARDQRQRALQHANAQRIAFSALKRSLKSGHTELREALDHPAAARAKVLELVGYAYVGANYLGVTRYPQPCGRAALAACAAMRPHIGHFTTVESLSAARKDRLAQLVSGRQLTGDGRARLASAAISAAS